MSSIRITDFSGLAPKLHPKALPDKNAQVAKNCRFDSLRLEPVKAPSDSPSTTLASTSKSIYLHDQTNWLEWDETQIDAVRGPIANQTFERIYFVGEDYPKVTREDIAFTVAPYPSTSYRLGIPAPGSAITATKGGTPDDPNEVSQSASYVQTYVSAWGEEGPPGPASTIQSFKTGEYFDLTLVAAPAGNYNFGTGALTRIYRSLTGTNGAAFQFVAELPIASGTYQDTTPGSELAEVIPSTTWIGPPDDDVSLYPDGPLVGLANTAFGSLMGFTVREVCFSESYLPHAWPLEYRYPVPDFDIVGAIPTTQGVVIGTTGRPYILIGSSPGAHLMHEIELNQACLGYRSMVDMGGAAIYAAPDGLVMVSGLQARVITEDLMNAEEFAYYNPASFRAYQHEGRYIAFYDNGSEQGALVLDLRNQDKHLYTYTYHYDVAFRDMEQDTLYVLKHDNTGDVYTWETGTTGSLTWKSKKFEMPVPKVMTACQVEADGYPVTLKVYADGVLKQTLTIADDKPRRLKGGFRAKDWEVEITSAYTVTSVSLADSIQELRDR